MNPANHCVEAAMHCATHVSSLTSSTGATYTDGMTLGHWLLALIITITYAI